MSYKLLSNPKDNPKVAKNTPFGVLTAPLHLAPYKLSGYNVCPKASQGCAAACLHTAGNPVFQKTKDKGRIRKTKLFFENRTTFMWHLIEDIRKLEAEALSSGLKCGVRLNATSDIQWENMGTPLGKTLMELYPNVQFYDYTKIVKRFFKPLPKNYHLTFSLAEDNEADAKKVLSLGHNVAVVFRTQDYPKRFLGYPVVDGDSHDYRPADPKGGYVIGLKAKGKAKKDTSGFVRDNVPTHTRKARTISVYLESEVV